MRTLLVGGGLVVLLACCPIPIPEQGLEVPELTVEVVDHQGDPVVVDVTLRRLITAPSPRSELARWTQTTASNGQTSFQRALIDEYSAPLMMHGRPELGFELCVNHAKYGVGTAELAANGRDPQAPAETVRLTLDTTRIDCGW